MKELPDGQLLFKLGEVGERLGIEAHVLRYWQKAFKNFIRPIKVGTRTRLYDQAQLDLFATIKRLLHDERFTIEGARKQLAGVPATERSRLFENPADAARRAKTATPSRRKKAAPDAIPEAPLDAAQEAQLDTSPEAAIGAAPEVAIGAAPEVATAAATATAPEAPLEPPAAAQVAPEAPPFNRKKLFDYVEDPPELAEPDITPAPDPAPIARKARSARGQFVGDREARTLRELIGEIRAGLVGLKEILLPGAGEPRPLAKDSDDGDLPG
jgi:DNA-binding transcriptional MerR regulator